MKTPQKGNSQQKRSWTQRLISGLAGLVLSAGCVTGGSVGAFVGSHNPLSQNFSYKFGNSTETGIRARAKTKSKVEVEVAYSGHKTNWNDGFSYSNLEASDLNVSASYPLFNNKKFNINTGVGIISRKEVESGGIYGIPGVYTVSENSSGWKAGVEVRYSPTENFSVEAGLDFHGFGEGSYEKSGTTLSFGASYNF